MTTKLFDPTGVMTFAIQYDVDVDAFTFERVYNGNDSALFLLFVPSEFGKQINLLAWEQKYMLAGELRISGCLCWPELCAIDVRSLRNRKRSSR